MTIDDQLRDIARHADQHQQVITAEEIIQRASSQGTGSFTTRSRCNDRHQVLDHMPVPVTEEEVIMIDPEWTGPTEPRRKGPMRVLVAAIVAAAAVVAIAFVVSRAATPADEPSPTVTVPPAPPPRALPAAPHGGPLNEMPTLEPGTHFVDEIGGTPTPRIYFTIGAGWQPLPPQSLHRKLARQPGQVHQRRNHRVQPRASQRRVLGRLPLERWVSPGASGHRRRFRRRAQ